MSCTYMYLGTVVAYCIINNNNDNNSIIITIIYVTRRSRRATHRARKIVFYRNIIQYFVIIFCFGTRASVCLFICFRDICEYVCVWCDLLTLCISFKRYCVDEKSSSVVFHDANALFDSSFIIAACAALLYDILQ